MASKSKRKSPAKPQPQPLEKSPAKRTLTCARVVTCLVFVLVSSLVSVLVMLSDYSPDHHFEPYGHVPGSWFRNANDWLSLAASEDGAEGSGMSRPLVWEVFVYSVFGMLVTGLGAVPFWFIDDFRHFSKKYIGVANAIAAGVMISASFGLIQEGFEVSSSSEFQTVVGVIIGLAIIWLCHHVIDKQEIDVGHLHGADARKALLVLAIMTIHSFAEGMGVGLSFCGSKGARTGRTISLAIAVHNIPEGLAIALVLLPKGESLLMTTLYCIMSSAPQPVISIPSFLLVQYFKVILPFGFGIAAGAMLWLTVAEILPEAFEALQDNSKVASVVVCAMAAMAAFQSWIHALM